MPAPPQSVDTADGHHRVFVFGSLKRGFPNHDNYAEHLGEFLGEATTRQAMPLVVPDEPFCNNPSCPYLHRMAALVRIKGRGKRVRGELYAVSDAGLAALDALEHFKGPGHPDNVYVRRPIRVVHDGRGVNALTYFVRDRKTHLDALRAGKAKAVAEYTLEMAKGTLKPGYEA